MKQLFAAVVLVSVCGVAPAQQYPNRNVTLVVPFPAGSATDLVARIIGPQLQQALGQNFIVSNKPGALAALGTAEVARSAPDGYTLILATNSSHAANVALFKKLAYDPVKDFAPIIRTTTVPTVLVTRADFPARTLTEFIDQAKAGHLKGGYWSSGSQVPIAKLKTYGKFSTLDVPYKGSPPTITAIIGDEVSFTFLDLTGAIPQMQSGKLKGLGVTSLKRSPFAPELPALAEVFPEFEVIVWHGLAAPAGTPPDVVKRLYDATSKIIANADVRAQLANLTLTVEPLNPDQFAAYIKREVAKWSKDIKDAGIEPQ